MNLFNTEQAKNNNIINNLLSQRNRRHNLLLINEDQLVINCDKINVGKKKSKNINNFEQEKKFSKTYSKMNSKNNSVINRNNNLSVNKYIDTHKKKVFEGMIKPLNFVTNNNSNNYFFTNNEKSKKIIINNKNINRTYNSFLLNKTLYNNGCFKNKKM